MSSTKIDLNIEIDVLTAGSVAEVVNAILEFLLYQRNQIPFVYKTYKYYVSKWADEEHQRQLGSVDNADAVPTVQNFLLQTQRERAKQSLESISAIRRIISETFDNHSVKSLRFLFGSTSMTPREVYTIHIPTDDISTRHSHQQHRIPQTRLNQTLINLMTSEDLYSIFSNNLNPTNMFMDIEMFDRCQESVNIFPKDYSEVPRSCKDVQIQLTHSKPIPICDDGLQCCKELQIFTDMICLNLSVDEERKNCENVQYGTGSTSLTAAWWEAEIIVRGFREKPMKVGNIW